MSTREIIETTGRVAPLARAVVHAGGVETPYLRAGSGSVVVLLATDLDRDDVLNTIKTLSRDFLILAAAPGMREPGDLVRWLHDFLECLGAADAHLFLHDPAAAILLGEHIDA